MNTSLSWIFIQKIFVSWSQQKVWLIFWKFGLNQARLFINCYVGFCLNWQKKGCTSDCSKNSDLQSLARASLFGEAYQPADHLLTQAHSWLLNEMVLLQVYRISEVKSPFDMFKAFIVYIDISSWSGKHVYLSRLAFICSHYLMRYHLLK